MVRSEYGIARRSWPLSASSTPSTIWHYLRVTTAWLYRWDHEDIQPAPDYTAALTRGSGAAAAIQPRLPPALSTTWISY